MYKIPLQNISNLNNHITFFCRKEDGTLDIIHNDKFMPYYYEKTTDDKADAISIFGEPLRKIYCDKPSDIRKQRSPEAYEADLAFCKRIIIDNVEEIIKSKTRILFMDIEVDCKELPHPKEDQKLDSPISIIRFYDNYNKKWKSWRLDKWKSEFEMLDDFCKTIKQISPDVITFWNKEFDYYALYYRIGEQFPAMISPIGQIHWRNGFTMPAGISFVDLMGLYAKYTLHKKDSYALMNVANEELGTEIEEDFDFTDINVADEKNKLDIEKMIQLDEKLHLFDYFDEIRTSAKCQWEDLASEMRMYKWQSNNSKIIDMLALAEAKKLGVVLPSKKTGDEQEDYEKVEGAFRWLDRTGIFKDISDVDLSGAYPQIIIDFCLSPENFTDKPEPNTIKIDILTRENREYKTTYYVRQNPNAILPTLVKKLLSAKNELKTKVELLNKNSKEYEIQSIFYDSKKALTNTAYGVILLKFFRLFDNRVGESITFLIRDLLFIIKEKLEKNNKKVRYFDTDGAMIDGKEDITPLLNDWAFEWAMDNYGNDKVDIHFDYKGYFSSIFIQAMTRYRGRLETTTGQKIETKGIQCRRRDVGSWVKSFQEQLYDKILDDETKDNLIAWIKIKIDEMKNADIREIALPVKINKKLEDYKTTPKWKIPLEETKKLIPKFNQTIGSRFYIIYCKSVEKLALSKKYYQHIKKEDIDWDAMVEKNIFAILVPIFIGLQYELDLLNLAEQYLICLSSQFRQSLLERFSNKDKLIKYYSKKEFKKRNKNAE
jgi:DNA polymerase I